MHRVVAACCLALATVPPAATRRALAWARSHLPLDLLAGLGLAGAVCAVYLPLLQGVMPFSVDHNVHLYKVVETEQLLRSGRVSGWTDMEYAGYPHGVFYPAAAYLVIAALHMLGGISLTTAYAWTLLGVLLLTVFAVFFVARWHVSRGTALLAGIFALLDPGDWWVGGHEFTMHIGVWPSAVPGPLVLISLALLPRAIRRGTLSELLAPGLLLGLSVLFHPVALILIAAVAVPLVLALLSEDPPLALPALARAGGGLAAISFSVCAFWLVPFLAGSEFMHRAYIAPDSSKDVWEQLARGTLLGQPALWFGATLCGLPLLAKRKDAFSRFAALFVPTAIVLTTSDSLSFLHLRGPEESLVDLLQLERVYYVVRPLGFIAAAYALTTAAPLALEFLAEVRGGRGLALRLFAGVTAALVLLLPGVKLPGWPEHPVPQDLSISERNDLERALDAAATLVGPQDRLALEAQPNVRNSDHSLMGPVALRGFKVESIGSAAATMFRYHFETHAPEVLARLGTTAVLSRGEPAHKLAQLPLLGRFGDFELRRIERLPRAWIEDGPGEARVITWADERIEIAISGAGPASALRLMLGYYDCFKEQSGLDLQRFDYQGVVATTLPARDGRIVLRYQRPWRQRIGEAISVFGLLGFALAWQRERRLHALPSTAA